MGRAWVNGRLVDVDLPHILVSDGGFRSGAGVHATLRARRGVLVEWHDHVTRLRDAAAAFGIAVIPGDDELADWCRALLAAEGLAGSGDARREEPGDAVIRLTVTPGPTVASGGVDPEGRRVSRPTIVVEARPYEPFVVQGGRQGMRTVTSSLRVDPSSPLARLRTTSEADRVMTRREAAQAGADEALLPTIDGRLAGAVAASLFIVVGAGLATPSLRSGARPSAIRTWVLSDPATRALGMEPGEQDVLPHDLLGADEAFLANEEGEIVPLLEHDGRAIANGLPGLRTQALRAAREAWFDRASRAGSASGPGAAVPPNRTGAGSAPGPAGVTGRTSAAGGPRQPGEPGGSGEPGAPPEIPLRSRLLARSAALSRADRSQLGPGDVFAWVTTLTPAEITLMGRTIQEMLRTGASRHAEHAFGIAWDAGVRIPRDDRSTLMIEFIDLQLTVASVLVGRDLRAEHTAPAKQGLARLFDLGSRGREVETKALEAIDAAGPPARPGLIAVWNAWAAARFAPDIPVDAMAVLVRPWETVIGPLFEA